MARTCGGQDDAQAIWARDERGVAACDAFLLGTGDNVLAEASLVDRIWGIGLAASDRDAANPSRWPGTNLLGFALMDARAALRRDYED